MKELVCEDCGTTQNVKKTVCPYEKEINGKIIPVVLCNECYKCRWENT